MTVMISEDRLSASPTCTPKERAGAEQFESGSEVFFYCGNPEAPCTHTVYT